MDNFDSDEDGVEFSLPPVDEDNQALEASSNEASTKSPRELNIPYNTETVQRNLCENIESGEANDNTEEKQKIILPQQEQHTRVSQIRSDEKGLEVIGDAERKFLNEMIANELLHDTDGKYIESLSGRKMASGKVGEIQAQIKSTMEKAFWDIVMEGVAKNPPDYSQVIALVKEVRDELDAFVPQSWKQELYEAFDIELFAQILESGAKDVGYLAKLLDYALSLILKLEAPARDKETMEAHEKLVQELSNIVASMDSNSKFSFELALVRGLRFILEQIQILKQDIAAVRIKAIAPLIRGPAGYEYMQKMFALRHGTASEAIRRLPKTVHWLYQVQETIENEKNDANCSVDPNNNCSSSRPLSLVPSYTTGMDQIVMSIVTYVRLGLVEIASSMVAADKENAPETFELNIVRLRNAQNDFQKIVVIATSLLLVRQTLSEKGVLPAEVDDILVKASKQLDVILSDPLITIHHLGQLLANLCSSYAKGQADIDNYLMEVMTRVLNKSLSSDDVVFAKVMRTVKSSVQTVLLSQEHQSLPTAESLLKSIGAGFLREHVEKLADALNVMASVSVCVHEQWYASILADIKEAQE